MVFRFARTVVLALGLGVAAFGCSGTDQSGDADDSTNAQSSATTPAPWGAGYVSQSFPLATTALKMKAGQVIPSYIELKNIGTSTWDSNPYRHDAASRSHEPLRRLDVGEREPTE